MNLACLLNTTLHPSATRSRHCKTNLHILRSHLRRRSHIRRHRIDSLLPGTLFKMVRRQQPMDQGDEYDKDWVSSLRFFYVLILSPQHIASFCSCGHPSQNPLHCPDLSHDARGPGPLHLALLGHDARFGLGLFLRRVCACVQGFAGASALLWSMRCCECFFGMHCDNDTVS